MSKKLPNFHKAREITGIDNVKTLTALFPMEIGEWILGEIPRKQRSGFAWRSMALLLALLTGFDKNARDQKKQDPRELAACHLDGINE